MVKLRIPKVRKYKIQELKHIDGKEPEVFISREQVLKWAKEMQEDKNIKGVKPYLREVEK